MRPIKLTWRRGQTWMALSPQSPTNTMTGPVHIVPTWRQGWLGMPLGPQNRSGITTGSEPGTASMSVSNPIGILKGILRGLQDGPAILTQAQVFTSRWAHEGAYAHSPY